MNKFQRMICKTFNIEQEVIVNNINDPKSLLNNEVVTSKDELKDALISHVGWASESDEIIIGMESNPTQLRYVKLGSNKPIALYKKTIVITIEQKEWED